MDSENVFQMFSRVVNDGDSLRLNEIFDYFESINFKKTSTRAEANYSHPKIIPMDFITRPLNEQGETCLEVAVKNGHWSVLHDLLKQVKFFVYKQCKFPTHLPFALVYPANDKELIHDIIHKIPVAELFRNLISLDSDDFVWLEFILDAVMTSSITRVDKITALEFMGAAFIFWWPRNPRFHFKIHLSDMCLLKGIQCWKDALILRQATADGEPAIPQIPCASTQRLRNVLGDNVQEMTFEELELNERHVIGLLHHTNINWSGAQIAPFRIQAILMSHKICSQCNSVKTSLNLFYYEELVNSFFPNNGYMHGRAMNVSLFCIETFCSDVSNVLSSYQHLQFFIRSLCLVRTNAATSAKLLVFSKCILKVLANLHPQSLGKERCLDPDIWKIYNFFFMYFPVMNQDDLDKLVDYLSNYVEEFKLNRCLTTFLRVNNKIATNSRCIQYRHTIPILKFFLDAGVDPNETDENGEASVHILAKHSAVEGVPIMLKMLLNAGAHIDHGTPTGETLRSFFNQQRYQFHLPSFYPFDSLDDDPLNIVLPLSCYCAQSIRRNQIPFEDKLPLKLQKFVYVH